MAGRDVQVLFSAIQMLQDRESIELAPFVRAWHPAVDSCLLDSPMNVKEVLKREHIKREPAGNKI